MCRDSRDLLEIGLEIYSSPVSSGSYHESASRAESQMVVLISITSVDIVFLMPSSFPASGPPFPAVLGSIRFGLRLGLGLAALAVNLALTLTLTLTCSR